MTARSAIMECRHRIAFCERASNRKSLPRFPVWFFLFLCSHFYFDLFRDHFFFQLQAESWLLPLTDDCNLYSWGPLDPPPSHPDKAKKKNLQAVNELPSVPRVKGVYKLTEAFVRALLCSLALPPISPALSSLLLRPSRPLFHLTLPPALQFSPSTCLLHAPAAPWREPQLSASGSERRSPLSHV